MDLELFQSITKYPFAFEQKFYPSVELAQNITCEKKCKEKDCLHLLSDSRHCKEYICSKGFDCLLLIVNNVKYVLNGLIYSSNTNVPKGRKEVRKSWICNKDSVILFVKKIESIEKNIIKHENETTVKNFSSFHEFKNATKLFFSCTNEIINNLPGATFEEKLKNNGKIYFDLYDSLQLISSQLRMIDIFINPESIKFGDKKIINIYKLFEKMKILFTHISNRKREISIKIISEEWIDDCLCYDSIEFIPLILLDNAIKYSAPDSVIEIKIEQNRSNGLINIFVKNIGRFVPDNEKDKIFEKFYRGENAKQYSKEGIGIGLWIARQILAAHNSKISYHKDPHETRPVGLNIFKFNLSTN